jgi:hypothetical protein
MEIYKGPQSPGKDPQLWAIAKRRASFRYHLGAYIVIIGFLWAIWLFTGTDPGTGGNYYPWPIWSTAGWGLGLLFHYLGAYVWPSENSAEKEYDKLIKKKNAL